MNAASALTLVATHVLQTATVDRPCRIPNGFVISNLSADKRISLAGDAWLQSAQAHRARPRRPSFRLPGESEHVGEPLILPLQITAGPLVAPLDRALGDVEEVFSEPIG